MLDIVLGTAGKLQLLTMDDLRDKEEKLEVVVKFSDITDSDGAIFHREIDVHPDDRTKSLEICLEALQDPEDEENLLVTRWCPGRGEIRNLTRSQVEAIGWRYLSAQRQTSAKALEGSSGAVYAMVEALESQLGEEKETLSDALESFNSVLGSSEAVQEMLGEVARHFSKALPNQFRKEDLSLRTQNDPSDTVLKNTTLFLTNNGWDSPITEQSDGMRQLISLTLFDLVEGGNQIVAIDEPEIHLHPSGQRTIAQLLNSGASQKILVTHSSHIVQNFPPETVLAITSSGSSHQLDAENFRLQAEEEAHWWSPQILELLTASSVIVVEGIADRIIVEAAARAKGISLDRIGAIIFVLGGSGNFPAVYKLLGKKGFDIPVYGLVDDDSKDKWLGQVPGKLKDRIDHVVFVSNNDLEDEYCQALGAREVATRLVENRVINNIDSVVDSAGVEDISFVMPSQMASYCRGKKVASALAVAKTMTEDNANKIQSIKRLLDKLVSTLQNE